jgi:hypothetical protein
MSMKNCFALLAILLFPMVYSYGQTTTDFKKVRIGIQVAPNYSYRSLVYEENDVLANYIAKDIRTTELPKLGYTIGVLGNYAFSGKIGLELGVQYTNSGYSTGKRTILIADPNDPLLQNASETSTLVYNNHYIEVPVLLNLTFGQNKLRFISSIGITNGFLVKQGLKHVLESADGEKEIQRMGANKTGRAYNLLPTIALGVEYALSENVALRVQPTFRHGILSWGEPIKEYPWNAGLNVGLFYSLR